MRREGDPRAGVSSPGFPAEAPRLLIEARQARVDDIGAQVETEDARRAGPGVRAERPEGAAGQIAEIGEIEILKRGLLAPADIADNGKRGAVKHGGEVISRARRYAPVLAPRAADAIGAGVDKDIRIIGDVGGEIGRPLIIAGVTGFYVEFEAVARIDGAGAHSPAPVDEIGGGAEEGVAVAPVAALVKPVKAQAEIAAEKAVHRGTARPALKPPMAVLADAGEGRALETLARRYGVDGDYPADGAGGGDALGAAGVSDALDPEMLRPQQPRFDHRNPVDQEPAAQRRVGRLRSVAAHEQRRARGEVADELNPGDEPQQAVRIEGAAVNEGLPP